MTPALPVTRMNARDFSIPWAAVFVLIAIFFVANHTLRFSLHMAEDISLVAAEEKVAEGDVARQAAFLILGFLGAVWAIRYKRVGLRIRNWQSWLIISFLVWAFLSLAWTENAAFTFRRVVVLGLMCLGAAGVASRFRPYQVVFWVFLSTSVYLIIGIIAEVWLGTFHVFQMDYRFAGTIHPNSQGPNCVMLILSGLTILRAHRGNRRLVSFMVVAGLFFLILTRSRTAFAAGLCAVFWYYNQVAPMSRRVMILFSFVVASSAVILIAGDSIFPMLREGIFLGRYDDSVESLAGRSPLWSECLRYMDGRWLTGYGYGNFWNPERIAEISGAQGWEITNAHSVYLEMILNLGIVGLLLFLAVYFGGLRMASLKLRAGGQPVYGFYSAFLLFCILDGILDPAIPEATFLTFVSFVVLAQVALISNIAGGEEISSSTVRPRAR